MPLSKISNPFFSNNGTANVYSPSANTIAIRTSGTDKVFVDTNGVLLIANNTTGNAFPGSSHSIQIDQATLSSYAGANNYQTAIGSNFYWGAGYTSANAITTSIGGGSMLRMVNAAGSSNGVLEYMVSGNNNVVAGQAWPSTTTVFTVERDKTFALQGASRSSGTGISFPASQNASSDANTLDDYEEGTYTPTVKNGSTTLTYGTDWSIRLASSEVNYFPYVKVGKIVHIGFTLNFNSSQTGRFNFSLPFNLYGGDYTCAGSLGWYSTTSSVDGTVGYLGNGVDKLDFFWVTATGAHTNLGVNGSTEIYVNLSYIAAS